MPVTSSAKKALRRDQRRQNFNQPPKTWVKTALEQARQKKDAQSINLAYQALDRAAKKRIIHPNKAARLKSRLMNYLHSSEKVADKPPTSKKRSSSKKSTAS